MSRSADFRDSAIYNIVGACVVVACALAAPWLIVKGGYNLWAQHTGTVASVEFPMTAWDACEPDSLFDLPGAVGRSSGSRSRTSFNSKNCDGVWRPDGETTKTVRVYGVTTYPPPRFMDVRIHGDKAVTKSLALPAQLLFGIGCVWLVLFEGRRVLQRFRGGASSDSAAAQSENRPQAV
jgi:hypothetical protein